MKRRQNSKLEKKSCTRRDYVLRSMCSSPEPSRADSNQTNKPLPIATERTPVLCNKERSISSTWMHLKVIMQSCGATQNVLLLFEPVHCPPSCSLEVSARMGGRVPSAHRTAAGLSLPRSCARLASSTMFNRVRDIMIVCIVLLVSEMCAFRVAHTFALRSRVHTLSYA